MPAGVEFDPKPPPDDCRLATTKQAGDGLAPAGPEAGNGCAAVERGETVTDCAAEGSAETEKLPGAILLSRQSSLSLSWETPVGRTTNLRGKLNRHCVQTFGLNLTTMLTDALEIGPIAPS